MAMDFDFVNQACITQYEFNNLYNHLKFGHPVIALRVGEQVVELIFSFRQHVDLKERFCAALISHHIVHRETEDNQIILGARHDQLPEFLRELNVIVKEVRTHVEQASVLKFNPSALFSSPHAAQYQRAQAGSIHRCTFYSLANH